MFISGTRSAWRREIAQSARARLLGVAGDAVESVRESVKKGDGRLALALLKGMGMVSPEPVGSDDPDVVAKEMELARRSKKVELSGRRIK